MKTILVLSQNAVFDLGNGAGKEVIFKTLVGLSEHFKIDLIAPGLNPQINNCRFHQLHDALFNKLKRIPVIGFIYNFIYIMQLKIEIQKKISKNMINPDLVYLAGPWMSFIGHSIFENKKTIVVRYFGVNWNPEKHNSIKQKIKFYLKNKGYRKFGNLVIMTNDGTRGDEFLNRLNCPKLKIMFLPNGIDFVQEATEKTELRKILMSKYKIPESHSILLTVSRLTSWKRVDRAILGLKEALKYNSQISLLVVGDGEERQHLERLVQSEGLAKHVRFTGAIKHDQLRVYFSVCDIFLSLYDYSNAGNPLFEAMIYRCCIITLDSPAMKFFVSDKGAVLLKESSPYLIGIAINNLLSNKELLLEYGVNAEKEVKANLLPWNKRISIEVDKIIELSSLS
jgi:glycosyltransferase involved in cell wall biosynthesis